MAIVRTTKHETSAPAGKTKNASPAGRALPQRSNRAENGQFIAETQAELRRVVWPTRDQVVAGTVVTVLMLAFFALYVSGLDLLVQRFFEFVGLIDTTKTPTP
jgi:preprotein translocase subunit SecE